MTVKTMTRMARRKLAVALVAIGGLLLLASLLLGRSVFQFNEYDGAERRRPFPNEMLLEVRSVSPMKTRRPWFSTASPVFRDYTERVEAIELNSLKTVYVEMTEEDFHKCASPKPGDIYAAFGLEKDKHSLCRMVRYEGPREKAAIDRWFAQLP